MRESLRAEGSIVTWSGLQIPALVEACGTPSRSETLRPSKPAPVVPTRMAK